MKNEAGRVLSVVLAVVVAVAAIEGFALARLTSRVADLESRVPPESAGPLTPLALGGEVKSLAERLEAVDQDQRAMKEEGRERAARLSRMEKAVAVAKTLPDAAAPDAMPAGRLEETVAKLVDERIEKMPRGEGGEWKPTMDELDEKLELTDGQQLRSKQILDDAKQELFQLASLKRSDGTAKVDDLVAAVTDPIDPEAAMKQWFVSLFTDKIPGRDEPYISEIIRIKDRTERAIVEVLDADQGARLKKMNVDYLGVKTGYDPFAEYLQASFR